MLLTIDNISKKYSQEFILENISINIEESNIYGIVGINGAGKSTLIKIIQGLIFPDSGNIKFYINDKAKNIFYLPENFTPINYLSCIEYIQNYFYYLEKKPDLEEIVKAANMINFNPKYLEMPISSYSKGMTQKIFMIMLLISGSKLWILDEPMTGLDFITQNLLRSIFKDHIKNGGAIIFTSHNAYDIYTLSSKIAVIDGTKLSLVDDIEKFLKEYYINLD